MNVEVIPWEPMFDAAAKARQHAHAPYSRFAVGAAVLTEDGTIYAGCNVENSSYGLSLCAERNAIGQGIANGRKKVLAAAIVADSEQPCPPCGMCRQVLAEFGEPSLLVRSRTPSGKESSYTLGELLPHAFTRSFL